VANAATIEAFGRCPERHMLPQALKNTQSVTGAARLGKIQQGSGLLLPPDEGGVGFLSFKPWESLKTPILAAGKLNSFWTIIYSGMWFDTEPKFLGFMDSNIAWWRQYYNWQNRGDNNFPGDNPSMSRFTILEGSGLIALGLFPLILGIIGGCHIIADLRNVCNKNKWIEATKMSIFPVLFISNAAGFIAFTLKMPRYSVMKASYLLCSMPTFAICLSIGLMSIENRNIFKRAIIIIFTAIFLLSFEVDPVFLDTGLGDNT